MLTWVAPRRIFPPAGAALPPWIGGFGALPFAVRTGEREARVFFSGRDPLNRAQIGACTVDLDDLVVDPRSITEEALVAPGPAGAFDESGCSMSCIVRDGDRWLLYYTGWVLGRTVPFYLAVGLAVSDDCGRTFRKHSLAPVLDRGHADPFLTASPSILREGDLWRMWYISATHWEASAEGPRHHYLIKYAESADGLSWHRDGGVAIPFGPREHAMGRPHVVAEDGGYRMWFCVRGDRYRLACAESRDGFDWQRVDDQFVPPPRAGWDDAMQAYPAVLLHRGRGILFYNGNGYGATGFGCAVAEPPS
jgi:hypothetical protein